MLSTHPITHPLGQAMGCFMSYSNGVRSFLHYNPSIQVWSKFCQCHCCDKKIAYEQQDCYPQEGTWKLLYLLTFSLNFGLIYHEGNFHSGQGNTNSEVKLTIATRQQHFSKISLTRWGRVTHIYICKLTIMVQIMACRQAFIWTSDGTLLIGTLETNFSEISSEIQTFWFKKMHLKMSEKWQPFCLSLNRLTHCDTIWRNRSGSTLAQVMACCLTAPSHYLNQCWLIISKVQRHSRDGNFTKYTTIYH